MRKTLADYLREPIEKFFNDNSCLLYNASNNCPNKPATSNGSSGGVLTVNGISPDGSGNVALTIPSTPTTLYSGDGSTSGLRTVTLGGNLVFSGNQVQATKFFIKAVTSSSSIYPLEIQVAGNTNPAFRVDEVGVLSWGNSTVNRLSSNVLNFSATSGVQIFANNAAAAVSGAVLRFLPAGAVTFNAGSPSQFSFEGSWSASSGSNTVNVMQILPSITQTGSATGITRALYINPTLTTPADFRAIEVTVGKIVFGGVLAAGSLSDDTAAAAAGIPLGGLYLSSGAIKMRTV